MSHPATSHPATQDSTASESAAKPLSECTVEEVMHRRQTEQVATAPKERSWTVPGCQGTGDITMTMRLPEIQILDAEGHFVVVSPQQAAAIGTTLEYIDEWFNSTTDIIPTP